MARETENIIGTKIRIFVEERFILFIKKVSKDTMEKSRFSGIELGEPVPLTQLGRSKSNPGDDHKTYIETCIAGLLKVKVFR